jgi:hypothetical protein
MTSFFRFANKRASYPFGIISLQILDRISLQYAPNANFTRTIRKTHDTRNECTIHETNSRYTNEIKRTNYTENTNEQTHDTRNKRTIHETNA